MKRKQVVERWVVRCFLFIMVATAAMAAPGQTGNKEASKAAGPSIEITTLPPRGEGPDSMGTIAGKAVAEKAKEHKVVIFARTDKWYVQPYAASPDTTIGDDGGWETDTHLGYEYAALLVKSSYKPPATMGTLPKVGGAVLAIARAQAKKE